uniref:Uncharacterized protein n=1 Tax=Tanacetum cinerariifolium TaxID=118510 RepID=A0A699IKX8_TANCI|nr:hypothetical protein [Tanacetum cinerariifolium]
MGRFVLGSLWSLLKEPPMKEPPLTDREEVQEIEEINFWIISQKPADTSHLKDNVGVGVYRTQQPYVLKVVNKADRSVLIIDSITGDIMMGAEVKRIKTHCFRIEFEQLHRLLDARSANIYK